MVDQEEVPAVVDEQVALVPVAVADEVVPHLHPDHVAVPAWRLRRAQRFLPRSDVFQPEDGGAGIALDAAFHRDRHHAEPQELVQLVGGDLRLVAVPEPLVDPGRQDLPGERFAQPARFDVGPLRLCHPDWHLLDLHDRGRPEELFELRLAALPDLRGWGRLDGLRNGQQQQRNEQQHHEVPPAAASFTTY